ncbi:hypothetical protein JDV02_006998 [Purpureocillium takamizusanense]|uniref:YCII-related domain-containing protein n=1 Tax=Purpureocillium takamizusanense TaxID=2060973 RepID=A0A9Q8VCS1_9HYPO|nr:uncharacterized protein JDV02_006998 [Purpureocillium takamizusanense]UNI20958.1 hypothetical protein JDV02_006998 [Purpureocillium takamizusanense]
MTVAAATRLASRRTLTTLLTRPNTRTMASSTAAAAAAPHKFEFLVIVPDKPGTVQKRLEVRPQHFENMTPHVTSGAWKMGGGLRSKHRLAARRRELTQHRRPAEQRPCR